MPESSFCSNNSSTGAKTFPLFSYLPAELRLRVWDCSLPQSRVVPVRLESESQYERHTPRRRSPTGCMSSAKIPLNMHVCHESRSEALRQYRLAFRICGTPGQIFFNPSLDILYFGSRDGHMATESQFNLFVQMVDPDDLALVRRLAINESIFWPHAEYISSIATRLTIDVLDLVRARFPNLEELYIVPRDENPVYSCDTMLEEPRSPDLRLLCQIHEGMQVVVQANPSWRTPNWSIKVLNVRPDSPIHNTKTLSIIDDYEYYKVQDIQSQSQISTMDNSVLQCFPGF